MPIKVLATACLYIMKEHWLYMKQINILTSWNSETFLLVVCWAPAWQEFAQHSCEQWAAEGKFRGEPEDTYIVHVETKAKDAINFLTNNSARRAQMPKYFPCKAALAIIINRNLILGRKPCHQ